jgi:SAM-dependent methyltransferase
MVVEGVFRCPGCGHALRVDPHAAGPVCPGCGRRSDGGAGVLDLVPHRQPTPERAYYEAKYATAPGRTAPVDPWRHPAKIVNRALRRHLGSITGRRVLLLGNGDSAKELDFLRARPELLIVSDLSVAGPGGARRTGEHLLADAPVVFAAIDASDLPLADASIDVVYGNEVVHHLPDPGRFLDEVLRVLRPGGRAVLADNAHSPLWEAGKRTLLRPVLSWTLRRYPRSPADRRATRGPAFDLAELAAEIRRRGAEPYFERLGLFQYLWRRFTLTLLPRRWRHLGDSVPIARLLGRLDRRWARTPILRDQQIPMVWGLRKRASGGL